MKNQKTKRVFKENNLPSVTDLMSQTGKSRECILEELALVQPKVSIDKSIFKSDRNAVREAKKALKNNISNGENIIQFFANRIPSWGSIVLQGVRIETV